jgi:hypothetical protein
MSDTKMLQLLLDGQTKIRKDVKEVKEAVIKVDEKLTKRMDNLGLQIANLEDDAPTIEEFEGLEKKVTKIQKRLALS